MWTAVVMGLFRASGLAFAFAASLVELGAENFVLLLALAAGVGIILGMGLPAIGVYVMLAIPVAPALAKVGVEKADPSLVEDFHWLDDPGWGYGGNYLHVEADYLLLVENLLDTTHLPFLHPSTLGTDAFALGVRGHAARRPHPGGALADGQAAGALPQADGRLRGRA